MIEGITKDKKFYVGRSYMDAPETDGVIYIQNEENLELGEFINCKIIKTKDYDLIAKII